ncbi:MAG: hypothetical protein HQL78_09270 [Magnetococcales bacterium]|nr:hypothetical protein [Magnetococcales bacterium]
MSRHPASKRFLTAVTLGVLSGFLCIYLASRGHPEMANPFNPLFWIVFTDRVLIGMMVAFAGAFTVHPILGFSYHPWLRGACLGAVVSLPIAPGVLITPPTNGPLSAWVIFWGTIVAGAIYGSVIDWVATRVGGQGAALLPADDTHK